MHRWIGQIVCVVVLAACDGRGMAPGGDGGSPPVPMGCVSTQLCADRLDCADGERCNTALAEPVCQRIRCGTEGSACSDDALCADGLSCFRDVCDSHSPTTWCEEQACAGGIEAGCVSPDTDCAAVCELEAANYESDRRIAASAGCLAEFDALNDCWWAGDVCDPSRCEPQRSAYLDCRS